MAHLRLAIEDGVATITLSNPPLHVMTPRTINELHALIGRLGEPDIRAVVFTGDDEDFFIRHFSVEELDASAKGQGGKWEANIDEVLCALENLSKPVIAALNGSAAGGGLELALACDIRVAKDGPSRFGLPEISVGILPGGGGTQRLPAIVGRQRALEMILRARLITPRQAFAYGLIEELVDADVRETALDRAVAIAREIAGRSPLAVAHIKRLVREAVSPVTSEMLKLESRLFSELMQTPEAKSLLASVASQHKAVDSGSPQASDAESDR